MVLANEDRAALDQYVSPGATPVIITDGIEWSRPKDIRETRQELAGQLEEWRRDWENRETAAYLRHYSSRFSSDGTNLEQWSAKKQPNKFWQTN